MFLLGKIGSHSSLYGNCYQSKCSGLEACPVWLCKDLRIFILISELVQLAMALVQRH